MQRRELLSSMVATVSSALGGSRISALAIDADKPPEVIFLSYPYGIEASQWEKLRKEVKQILAQHGCETTQVLMLECASLVKPSDDLWVA